MCNSSRMRHRRNRKKSMGGGDRPVAPADDADEEVVNPVTCKHWTARIALLSMNMYTL